MIKSESITKIAPALIAAQTTMGDAKKSTNNPFFKSKFADLNSVREAVLPSLHENKIGVFQPTVVVEGKLYVQTTLLHDSGEYIAALTEVVCKDPNNAQQIGSAISYARRYGLQSMLNVGVVDEDGESAVGRGNHSTKEEKPAANGAAKTATTAATNGFSSFRKPAAT